MTWYFGSDWHLNDKRIIHRCQRNFSSIEQMQNDCFLSLSKVKSDDRIYLLGDILIKKDKDLLEKLKESVNGAEIHLIIGNHDWFLRGEAIFSSTSEYTTLLLGDFYTVLCHYPIELWNRKHYGSLHLHGHTHGNRYIDVKDLLPKVENRFDVSYDATGKWLVTLEELLESR